VEQTDTLIGSLTVREMLMYTALLKRPLEEEAAAKAAVVEHAIDTLGLARCADVRIGNALVKGISGGQAKRTNIGLALVSSPRVLFLDGARAVRARGPPAPADGPPAAQSPPPGWTASQPTR
jgi:ATP-binding cassette subfamily G (WHITE) protein 2